MDAAKCTTTTTRHLAQRFLRVGLPLSHDDIAVFIRIHQLPRATKITLAPCWRESQRQLLSEQSNEGAESAIVVDEHSEALHAEVGKRG